MAALVLGSVAGCGASSAEMPAEIPDITGDYPVNVDYEVPVQIPGTLVDQVGYGAGSDKVAVFRGKTLPEEFDVYEVASGQKVFSGEILRSVYDEQTGEYCSSGYFTDLSDEGEYYICTDALGESYPFKISQDIFRDVFTKACKQYYINRCGIALSENYAGESAHSACHTQMAHLQEDPEAALDVTGGWHLDGQAGRDTGLGSSVVENLLLAYEMNPTAFTDETGIPESGNSIPDILDEVRYEVEWLLKMQDSKTGGEYGQAITDTSKGGDLFLAPVYVTPVSMEATISFACALARFSVMYQQYDAEFATLCLKAADRAYSCFLNNQEAMDNTAAFKAAALLYRATGDSVYSNVLDEYFTKEDFMKLFDGDENVFLGGITYLSINHPVDVEVCKSLMKALMKRSEEIAARSSKSSYHVSDEGTDDGFKKMLQDMRCLTITDHIIYNHEYTTIIENHVHYLCGMNPDAINYVSSDTKRTYLTAEKQGVTNDPTKDSLLIFMLSLLEK